MYAKCSFVPESTLKSETLCSSLFTLRMLCPLLWHNVIFVYWCLNVPGIEWQVTGLLLHCHIQTTGERQRPTMWVLANSFCWGVPLLMLTPTWPGAEGGRTTWACPLEWKSGTGYCGFYLCRCLMMDPTPVRKGTETPVLLSRFDCIRSWLHKELKAA